MSKRIRYTEFPSGRETYTRGKFIGWIRGGLVGFVYAVIERKASTLYIPRQDIHRADLAMLPPIPYPVPSELPCEPDGT